jgi:RNA polymerase sigma factor (sigma-70 family)
MLGSDALAEDALHDVLLALLEQPEQFENRSTLLTWLYSATTHRCLNTLRDGKNRQRILEARGKAVDERGSDEMLENAVALRELLARLPANLAHVAVYYYGDEMTHDEIARVLDCSKRHVGNLLQRLRAWVDTEEASP